MKKLLFAIFILVLSQVYLLAQVHGDNDPMFRARITFTSGEVIETPFWFGWGKEITVYDYSNPLPGNRDKSDPNYFIYTGNSYPRFYIAVNKIKQINIGEQIHKQRISYPSGYSVDGWFLSEILTDDGLYRVILWTVVEGGPGRSLAQFNPDIDPGILETFLKKNIEVKPQNMKKIEILR